MPLVPCVTCLPAPGILLALDGGTRRIGVAASDFAQRIALPVGVVARPSRAAMPLAQIWSHYDARDAVGLIVGLPLNMNGTEGPSARSARAMARSLLAEREVPVAFFDERLSSVAAERELIACDARRAARRRLVDAAAACLVLRAALGRRGAIPRFAEPVSP